MRIERINIEDYKSFLGKNAGEHEKFKVNLPEVITKKLLSLETRDLDVYNLEGERHSMCVGQEKQRMIIFVNTTHNSAPEGDLFLEEPKEINGIENTYKKFLKPSGKGLIIESENNIALAEWIEERECYYLNILFNIFEEYNQVALDVFEYIMEKFEEKVWYPKTLENSWIHTSNKEKLTENFIGAIKNSMSSELENERRRLEGIENDINQYRRRIKRLSDSAILKRKQIETQEQMFDNAGEGLIKDLNNIVENEKVEDLHIKDGIFIIYTKPLYIYSDEDKRYYGGRYRIELNPDNSDVRFFGDNPRKSYWTKQDPHPHVNGSNGQACLGNISSTIALLCSQMQIYALTLTCIDFLESANTSDAAGRQIRHWDEVDEEGNIINKGITNPMLCEQCDCEFDEDELTIAYEYVDDDDGEPIGRNFVCQDCLEEYYHFNEEADVYVRN